MTSHTVLVRGDGVAALACAHLLLRAGHKVSLEPRDRRPVPALLLSDQALHLLGDIFENRALFADRHRITARHVAWGGETIVLPHRGVVLAEDELALCLPRPKQTHPVPSFTVQTAPPLPPPATTKRFGSQQASGAQATLKASTDAAACYVESLPAGWLFLIPTSVRNAWLLAVGAGTTELLDSSRLIAPVLDRVEAPTRTFETSPSIATPVRGDDWILCGSAAMTFDPLCGDGTANAAREAILATAVLKAVAAGEDKGNLLLHYESLLIGAMRRHLATCADFYASGGDGPWWRLQTRLLREGHDWCTAQLAGMPEPRYRLRDFDLIPFETARTP